MKQALQHLKIKDPILHEYALKVKRIEVIQKEKPERYFYQLCRDIVGQQLSGKAAETIFGRFEKLFPDGKIQPSNILTIPHEKMRAVGMSNAKARYVHHLAEAVQNEGLRLLQLDSLPDEEVIIELTKVKGIGRWTAEMFLIFTLGRQDIFSYGDLGLKKGLMKIYGFKKEPTKKQVEKIVKKWSPYKSFASRVLWGSLEMK
ncbi:DNA-3-methyladenine glycosylase 2 family protein [Candidatus Roizmanbacteria bacterium]|nr:DNA-3-methyladenine glycosylase 2 family protein [Candidatus Roizmanbacteria bacterium]